MREDIEGFNRELMEYLIWYNTERVHSGIGGKAPLGYFCDKFLKNSAESKIIWTHKTTLDKKSSKGYIKKQS